jgi:hypothetical protein
LGSEQETFGALLHAMQQCWRTKTTPVTWSRSHVAVMPKKGDISPPKNFRSMMVGDFDGKLHQIILNNRLKVLHENIAPEHSNGFRPGRGTADSLFIFL